MYAVSCRFFSSLTTANRIVTWFDPDGACSAIATHSRISGSGTGREKSRRLRTARVVDSSWSGSRLSKVMPPRLASGPRSRALLGPAAARQREGQQRAPGPDGERQAEADRAE